MMERAGCLLLDALLVFFNTLGPTDHEPNLERGFVGTWFCGNMLQ
jgi:hypothetical protein